MSDPNNMKEVAQQLGLTRERAEGPAAETQGDPIRKRQQALEDAGLPAEFGTFLDGVNDADIPNRIEKLKALAGTRSTTEPEHIRVARAALEHAEKINHENAAELAALAQLRSNEEHLRTVHNIHPDKAD